MPSPYQPPSNPPPHKCEQLPSPLPCSSVAVYRMLSGPSSGWMVGVTTTLVDEYPPGWPVCARLRVKGLACFRVLGFRDMHHLAQETFLCLAKRCDRQELKLVTVATLHMYVPTPFILSVCLG